MVSPEFIESFLTNRKGVFGQWCVISGTHFSFIFSNELGLTTEKQTRKTSVCGYDNGRSLKSIITSSVSPPRFQWLILYHS